MPNITVYVTDKIKKIIDKNRNKLSLSAIFADAVTREINRMNKRSMEIDVNAEIPMDVIAKLKSEKQDSETNENDMSIGIKEGFECATNLSSYDELADELKSARDFIANEYRRSDYHKHVIEELYAACSEDDVEEVAGNDIFSFDTFLEGFANGIIKFWEKVEVHL